MRTTTFTLGMGLVVALGIAAIAADAPIRDPLAAYPENYQVLLENEHVRVLDFRLKKGATEKAHMHPRHIAVFLETFQIRFTLPDGKTAIRDAKPGIVAYSEPVTHASENVGSTDAHGILIELKD